MKKIKLLISSYILKVSEFTDLRLVVELTCVALVSKLVFSFVFVSLFILILTILGFNPEQYDKYLQSENHISPTDPYAYLLAPWLETILNQVLPIELLLLITKKRWLIIAISSVLFSLLHGDLVSFVAVLPVGIVLAGVYLLKRTISFKKAFLLTTTIHLLHNLISGGIQYFIGI